MDSGPRSFSHIQEWSFRDPDVGRFSDLFSFLLEVVYRMVVHSSLRNSLNVFVLSMPMVQRHTSLWAVMLGRELNFRSIGTL